MSLPVDDSKLTHKMTAAQVRREYDKLLIEYEKLEKNYDRIKGKIYCPMCDTQKNRSDFYVSKDQRMKGKVSRICKLCAKKIACRYDEETGYHQSTKASLVEALKYLDFPYIEEVYDASLQEVQGAGVDSQQTVAGAYFRNISASKFDGMRFEDSDFYKGKICEGFDTGETSTQVVATEITGTDYDNYIKNKNDVVRLLDYDPFSKEEIEDRPLLYSQLIGFLDANEDSNDDMMRTASAISIVRGFLQQQKIDDTITGLMSDPKGLERNSSTIRSLQDSKAKLTNMITNLAQDSCISLKHNKNAKKGENTWTGKIKKIKDLGLREGEVNGFDLETCKAMRQVMDLSNASIMKSLALDESEWSDMVAEQRKKIIELQDELGKYTEISRILLRENLDIKDYLNSKDIKVEMNMVNLNDLFSCFSTSDESDEGDGDAV